jgi:prephenate dehydrogenase
MSEPFRHVALIGLGLIGGSIARSLRAMRGTEIRITAWTPDGVDPRSALFAGVLDDAAASPADAVAGADLVVLAAPVGACIELLPHVVEGLRADACVTDVAGIKRSICRAATDVGLGSRFVGAHPLCGSERSGWAAARDDLFQGAPLFIVACGSDTNTARVEAWWADLGAVTRRVDAAAHDTEMAWVSHMPQVLASALGATLADAGLLRNRLGPGGRDMTRLSASSPDLWTDLLLRNGDVLLPALTALRERLARAAAAIERGDAGVIDDLLQSARTWTESDPA